MFLHCLILVVMTHKIFLRSENPNSLAVLLLPFQDSQYAWNDVLPLPNTLIHAMSESSWYISTYQPSQPTKVYSIQPSGHGMCSHLNLPKYIPVPSKWSTIASQTIAAGISERWLFGVEVMNFPFLRASSCQICLVCLSSVNNYSKSKLWYNMYNMYIPYILPVYIHITSTIDPPCGNSSGLSSLGMIQMSIQSF